MRYTTEDIMEATGLSADDIKNYVRRDLLSHPIDPPEHGKQRFFDRESVIDFALLARLSALGVTLPKAKKWIGELLPKLGKNWPLLFLFHPKIEQPRLIPEKDLDQWIDLVKRLLLLGHDAVFVNTKDLVHRIDRILAERTKDRR